MKTLIVILILAAFLQTTILPIDLVLLILICRSYINPGRENLYLGFGFGLLISFLSLTALGIQSLIYVALIQIVESLSRSRLSGHPILIMPISLVLLSLDQFLNLLINHGAFDFPKIILAAVLSLPTLFIVRLWEERFIVRKDIKLKI